MGNLVIASGLAFLLAGHCGPLPPPTDPDPPVVPDGGLEPEDDATACGRACSRMARLGCPGHEGSPGKASCEEVCENQEASGVSSFCPNDIEHIQGKLDVDGERVCDEDELQEAFEACE